MNAERVVAEARKRIGMPYSHQAATDGVACDCIGLVACVAAALGVPAAATWERDARRLSYSAQPDPQQLLEAAAEYLQPIRIADARAGDVLLMRLARDPAHFAIHAGATMIHAWKSSGCVVENSIDSVWKRRIVGAYRFR